MRRARRGTFELAAPAAASRPSRNAAPPRTSGPASESQGLAVPAPPATACAAPDFGTRRNIWTGAEPRQDPLPVLEGARGRVAGGGAVAAPTPVPRARHHASADRVHHHIAAKLEQMRFALHQNCLVAALEDVPGPPVRPVGRWVKTPFSCRMPRDRFALGVSTSRW